MSKEICSRCGDLLDNTDSAHLCRFPYTVPKPPPAHKEQVGGDHYKKMAIQPIEYIMANKLGYCEGNIVKYISRWRDKGGVEDLRKIKQYVDFLIEGENGR
jgi:hypothetical protein